MRSLQQQGIVIMRSTEVEFMEKKTTRMEMFHKRQLEMNKQGILKWDGLTWIYEAQKRSFLYFEDVPKKMCKDNMM